MSFIKVRHFFKDIFSYIYLRVNGVEVQFRSVKLIGLPKIIKHPGSRIVLEKNVTLNSKTYGNSIGINHPVILSTLSENAIIEIKDGCGISGSSIVAVKKVIIGCHAGLGANACVFDTDFHPVDPDKRRQQQSINEAKSDPVVIGDDVLIGMNSVVLKGVTIGDGAFIGANSVVTHSVPAKTVWAGNPAKKIKEIE